MAHGVVPKQSAETATGTKYFEQGKYKNRQDGRCLRTSEVARVHKIAHPN